MFKLNKNYEVDRLFLNCDFMRFSPAKTSTINTPKSEVYINLPREYSVISLLNSYLEINFEVLKRTDNSRYANGDDTRLVNLAPIALFSKFKLTTSSGKHLEDNSCPHIVSLMYKLLTSSRGSEDLSLGFHRDLVVKQDQLARNKNIKGKNHLRIMLKDVFNFAEPYEKATYGLGFKLAVTKNKDDSVLQKAVALADARNKIDHIYW